MFCSGDAPKDKLIQKIKPDTLSLVVPQQRYKLLRPGTLGPMLTSFILTHRGSTSMSPVHVPLHTPASHFPQVNSQVPGKVLYKLEFPPRLSLIPAYLWASHSYFQFLYYLLLLTLPNTKIVLLWVFVSLLSYTGKAQSPNQPFTALVPKSRKCSKNTMLTEMSFSSTKVIHK